MDPAKLPAIRGADLDADPGRRDAPRPRPGRAPGRRRVRRLHPARRRLAVRDQGRPDPRRPARARPGARRARPGSTWCSRSCGPARSGAARRGAVPGLRAALGPQGAAPDSARGRRGRGAGPRARRGDGGRRLAEAAGAVVEDVLDDPDEVVARCWRSPPTRSCRGWRAPPTSSTHVLHALDGGFVPAGPVRLAAARPGQRAADRPQLLHRRPEGGARPGSPGRPASRWPTRCVERYLADTGELPALGRPVGLGHLRDAHPRRRHRRGAGAARRPARVGRGVAPGHRPRGRPARRAGPAAHRRHGAHLRLLPRRVPARRGAARRRRRARSPSSTSRRTRTTSAPTRSADLAEHGDERRATTRIFGSKPGSYGAGHAAADRVRQLARRRRPRRGLHGLGRLRLRPRPRRRAGRATTCGPTTGGSRSPRRTSTPASTTSPTPTTTSSTTAAWSPRCAR